MRTSSFVAVIGLIGTTVAVGCGGSSPLAPTQATPFGLSSHGAAVPGSQPDEASTAASWGPATPPFNLEAVLRPLQDAGFGLVKFRQPKDENRIVYLDVWVRDLVPNTDYSLQRAVDVTVDGQCTSTGWLTLGQGLQPHPVTTDESGTGRASLFRDLGMFPPGQRFDIHFRLIETATLTPVLQSACYEFVISQ